MMAARRQIVATAKIGSAANGAAVLEELLETIGRGTAKAACDGAEQIEIYGALCALEGGSGICQVLRTTRRTIDPRAEFALVAMTSFLIYVVFRCQSRRNPPQSMGNFLRSIHMNVKFRVND